MIELPAGKEVLQATTPDDDAWHAIRKTGVGASEAAPLMNEGYSGRNAYTVWEEKVTPYPPVYDEATLRLFARGHALEPLVADVWAQQNPDLGPLLTTCGVVRSNTNPYALATPDRVAEDNSFGLEIKTAGQFAFRKFLPEVVPRTYWWQAVHSLLVTGMPTWHIVALHPDTWNTISWTLYADDPQVQADMKLLDLTVLDFWESYVLTGHPPDATGQAEEMYTPVEGGTDLTADDDADSYLAMLARRRELADEIKELTDEKKDIDDLLKGKALQGPVHLGGKPLWELTVAERVSVDTKKLQQLSPEVYEQVKKVSKVKSINVKK